MYTEGEQQQQQAESVRPVRVETRKEALLLGSLLGLVLRDPAAGAPDLLGAVLRLLDLLARGLLLFLCVCDTHMITHAATMKAWYIVKRRRLFTLKNSSLTHAPKIASVCGGGCEKNTLQMRPAHVQNQQGVSPRFSQAKTRWGRQNFSDPPEEASSTYNLTAVHAPQRKKSDRAIKPKHLRGGRSEFGKG